MDQCISKYGNLVWSITQRYINNRSTAEDVVQEIFTELWKSAERYDSKVANEATFIGVLARRRSIDYIRKEKRSPIDQQGMDSEYISSLPAATSKPIDCESQNIRAAIKQLSTETQKIFNLHFDKGMTHPEIVESTGLPLGTIKTRLRRGLIEVRNMLRKPENSNVFTTPASNE